MRQCLIVSRHDVQLLPDWCEVVAHLGCGLQHDLHIVVPRSVSSEAFDAAAQLEGQFQSIQVHQIDIDPSGGWPLAPNVFFWQCAQFMLKDNPNTPWQLVELDCLPLRSNSFDAVSAQCINSGSAFFGNIGLTPWRNDDGKIAPSLFGKDDVMMSGCAVYPGNLLLRPNFVGMMADFVKGVESIDLPWDMHLRGAMRAEGMAHTDLIANHWNTINYRVEDGVIVCDPSPTHEIFSQHPTWEKRDCSGRINPAAQMIHGCKDSSLRDLILNDKIPNAVMAPKRVLASSSTQAPVVPQESQEVATLKGEMSELKAMLAQVLKSQMGMSQVAAPPAEKVAQLAVSSAKIPRPQGTSEAESVMQLLATTTKNMRAGDVTRATGIPINKLREMAKSESCPFDVKGSLGWVSAKQLQAS